MLVGWDLWSSFSPGSLEQVTQEHTQACFEYLQREKRLLWAGCSNALSASKLITSSSCLYGTLCIPVCAYCLVLLLNTTERSLAPSTWLLPDRYLQASIRSPLNLLFFRLSCCPRSLNMEENSLLWPAGQSFQCIIGLLGHKGPLLAELLPTRTPRSFFAEFLSIRSASNMYRVCENPKWGNKVPWE